MEAAKQATVYPLRTRPDVTKPAGFAQVWERIKAETREAGFRWNPPCKSDVPLIKGS